MAELTGKQARFVEEYLIDLNATQAATRAGYGEKNAKQQGTENLAKPIIAEAIAKAKAERSKRTLVTADEVIQELKKLALSNVLDFTKVGEDGKTLEVDLSELTRDQAAAIKEIKTTVLKSGDKVLSAETELKLADKRGPLQDLGKHLELFTEVVKHKGDDLRDAIREGNKRVSDG